MLNHSIEVPLRVFKHGDIVWELSKRIDEIDATGGEK